MPTSLADAVRAILPELIKLDAAAIELQLRDLLERDYRGEDVNLQLKQLLKNDYPRVWARVQAVLHDPTRSQIEAHKSFSPLGGDHIPPPPLGDKSFSPLGGDRIPPLPLGDKDKPKPK